MFPVMFVLMCLLLRMMMTAMIVIIMKFDAGATNDAAMTAVVMAKML